MNLKLTKFFAPTIAILAVTACNASRTSSVPVGTEANHTLSGSRAVVPEWEAKGLATPACPQVTGKPACLALVESKALRGTTISAWTPADIQARYNLPSATNGAGQIVAIVDAYDNPHVASDLAEYRKKFNLGPATFYKYNQEGAQSNYPGGDKGWGLEIDLDVDMVSAACPLCTIYLVEANSSAPSDLEDAEAEAASLGAQVVSNSWICGGSNTCVSSSYFSAPGVIYTAASGDTGYDDNGAPESLASVVSVGGTILSRKGSNYGEIVADFSGGGCSDNGNGVGVAKPSWQTDPDCAFRTDADVSAVAWDVAEYDTYRFRGWFWIGGTSVAAPIIAAVFALAGNASGQNAGENFWSMSVRQRAKELHHISRGEDGSCGGEYLCKAGTKQFGTYSGPVGWGTPNGIGAF